MRQINEQIVLYVLSRTFLSLLPRLYTSSPRPPSYPFQPLSHPLPALSSIEGNPRPIPPAPLPFAVVSALSWAGVMYMFRHRGERIQPGMNNSMRKCASPSESQRPSSSKLGYSARFQPTSMQGMASTVTDGETKTSTDTHS